VRPDFCEIAAHFQALCRKRAERFLPFSVIFLANGKTDAPRAELNQTYLDDTSAMALFIGTN
jgi:hypothetical protein